MTKNQTLKYKKRNKRGEQNKKYNAHNKSVIHGGSFTQQDKHQLQEYGFTQYQIQSLEEFNLNLDQILNKINQLNTQMNTLNQDELLDQVMNDLYNENIQNQDIPFIEHDENDLHYLENNDDMHDLNISDLDYEGRESGNTTMEDFSFGGKKCKKLNKTRHKKINRKTKNKIYKEKNTRKHKGGSICFGNGVGANNNDPNFSIYNTNMLKLFPYK